MKDIDQYLYDFLRSKQFTTRMAEMRGESITEHPVTMTYAIERLMITHVKLFMLEMQPEKKNYPDEEIGAIKRKIDYWNGKVRPRLIASLGDMAAEAILGKDADIIKEPDLKDYKAR